MTSKRSENVFLGLPGSGKTTYLAALWHQMESGELQLGLSVDRLHADREYLNKIRSRWLSFEPVERTSIRGEQVVSMGIREADTGRLFQATFPDLSGESYKLQWTERSTSGAYVELVTAATGLIVFVHPHSIIPATRINDARAPLETQEPSPDQNHKPTPSSKSTLRPWSPELSPTQVQLVELIQFVLFLSPRRPLPLPTTIVISAWDVVAPGLQPKEWLARRLPLFDQFLTANDDRLSVRIFGVSAQGGDLR